MPSNQLPEDVREKLIRVIRHAGVQHGTGTGTVEMAVSALPEVFADTVLDAIAPLIIEWAREDQAEVDARIAKDGGTFWDAELGQYRSLYPAEVEAAIRTQFTPETTGGKTE